MKKTIVLFSAALISFAMMSFDILSDNGIASKNGAPGETGACNQVGCHSGNPLNDAGGSLTISAPTLTGFQYTLGQTYTISVTVSRTGVNLFGFGFEALTSAGASAGTLVITDAVTTTIKSLTVGGNLRKNMVHKLNGGATTNTHTFTFDWTAPLTNVGDITFYYAGNAANGNTLTSGDFIYTGSQLVTPAPVGIVEKQSSDFNFSVFPNPAVESATISYALAENSKVEAKLVSVTGEVVATFFSKEENAGKYEQKLVLDPGISNGIYLIALSVNGKQSFKKLIIN